jgi:NNP family nitrate/nitrite transporter-like MFS transporter
MGCRLRVPALNECVVPRRSFTRATGGILSDVVAVRWGMRGRIWALWIIQTLGCVFCIILGKVSDNLTNSIVIMVRHEAGIEPPGPGTLQRSSAGSRRAPAPCSDAHPSPAAAPPQIVFSVFCQQACGLHFGITPFVSRRAYGVVSGLVGAGGNVGAAITQAIWFAGTAPWQLT